MQEAKESLIIKLHDADRIGLKPLAKFLSSINTLYHTFIQQETNIAKYDVLDIQQNFYIEAIKKGSLIITLVRSLNVIKDTIVTQFNQYIDNRIKSFLTDSDYRDALEKINPMTLKALRGIVNDNIVSNVSFKSRHNRKLTYGFAYSASDMHKMRQRLSMASRKIKLEICPYEAVNFVISQIANTSSQSSVDRGIISSISDDVTKVYYLSDIKKKMITSNHNPLCLTYTVDVDAHYKKNRLIAYYIKSLV